MALTNEEKEEVIMRCKKHKRYEAKLRPRCNCVGCWSMFLNKTANYNDVCKEIERREGPKTGSIILDCGSIEEFMIDSMLRDKKKELEIQI